MNWPSKETLLYLVAFFSVIGAILKFGKQTVQFFVNSWKIHKQGKMDQDQKEKNKPVEIAGWFYLPHEPAPRLPLCPKCLKGEKQQHMNKIDRLDWTRGFPLKWKYHCDECQTTMEVPNEMRDLLFLKLGQRWP